MLFLSPTLIRISYLVQILNDPILIYLLGVTVPGPLPQPVPVVRHNYDSYFNLNFENGPHTVVSGAAPGPLPRPSAVEHSGQSVLQMAVAAAEQRALQVDIHIIC